MSIEEIETAISHLAKPELKRLAAWLEKCQTNSWDQAEETHPFALPFPPALQSRYPLRGTPVHYQDPAQPVAEQDWEAA